MNKLGGCPFVLDTPPFPLDDGLDQTEVKHLTPSDGQMGEAGNDETSPS